MTDIDLSRADWHKSSYSSQNGNCVEVATNLPDVVAVRDSKNPEGSVLVVTADVWRAFIVQVQAGEFG
jgi:hypothetical protein